MTIFNKNQFTKTERTAKLGGVIIPVFTAEASELGLKVGESMPSQLWVKGEHNTLMFSFVCIEWNDADEDNEIVGWRYRALGGTEVLIIND